MRSKETQYRYRAAICTYAQTVQVTWIRWSCLGDHVRISTMKRLRRGCGAVAGHTRAAIVLLHLQDDPANHSRICPLQSYGLTSVLRHRFQLMRATRVVRVVQCVCARPRSIAKFPLNAIENPRFFIFIVLIIRAMFCVPVSCLRSLFDSFFLNSSPSVECQRHTPTYIFVWPYIFV